MASASERGERRTRHWGVNLVGIMDPARAGPGARSAKVRRLIQSRQVLSGLERTPPDPAATAGAERRVEARFCVLSHHHGDEHGPIPQVRWIVLSGLVCACSGPTLGAGGAEPAMRLAPVPSPAVVDAYAVDSALATVAATTIWPGFEPLRTPLAIYDGRNYRALPAPVSSTRLPVAIVARRCVRSSGS